MQEVTIDAAARWQNEYLPSMFGDSRFQQYGKFKFYGEIDGAKGGVVLATFNPKYGTFALNKGDFDRLLDAKRIGKIDLAFVVRAAADQATGAMTYRGAYEAESLNASVLANLPLRTSNFGPFYVLPPEPGDEPF